MFLEFFNHVSHGTAACGTALERRERIAAQMRRNVISGARRACDQIWPM
jgi:hypothetical protein